MEVNRLSEKGLGERRRGGVLGRMGGFALGPGGYCVCPKCGYTEEHKLGEPCFLKKCPRCGATLTRKIGSSSGIFGLGILRF